MQWREMSCYFDISGGRCWCRGEEVYCGETKITKTLQEAKEQDFESSKGNRGTEKIVEGYGVNPRERNNEKGQRRGKEQIICWHWVSWRKAYSWILVPASISKVMQKKAETLGLAQFLYSLH